MPATHAVTRLLAVPAELGLDSRVEFRRVAVALLDQLPEGNGQLILNMALTRHVDSAGLGTLMLIQHRAEERRLQVVLRGVSDEVRFLLVLTKLDDLFLIQDTPS
ncbi:MAG: STAS domain-containing protein [Gemmatimonadota bacterium]|nr:STAS domain-containing protein [Gemmatimonadota bacterium]